MPHSSAYLEEKLSSLHYNYRNSLASAIADIAPFIQLLTQRVESLDMAETLTPIAHRLSGSGATFGFPIISNVAKECETLLLSPLLDKTALLGALQRLTYACEEAISFPVSLPIPTIESASPLTTILIADDDDTIRELLKQQLGGQHNRVIMAGDGQAALSLAKAILPDLIILDGNMPKQDGFTVLDQLKKNPATADIPVILLTARKTQQDIIGGLSKGAVKYVTKPFSPEELTASVSHIMSRRKIKILIGDDDALTLQLLKFKFEHAGFTVLTATDGGMVLEYAATYRPELIILDKMMPVMDGMRVLQQLKYHRELRDIPVILLSALRQEKDIVRGFQLGASDYITKPFMPEELMARAMRTLKGTIHG